VREKEYIRSLDYASPRRIAWLLLLVGCATGSDDTSGFTSAGVPGVSSSVGGTSDEPTSDTGSTGAEDDTGGVLDDTGMSNDDDDDDDDDASTTNDTSSNDDDPDPPGPMEVNVQNHTGVCGGVLWCTDSETNQGVGPHGFAECFDNVGVTPPYDVVEIRYAVGQKQNDPSMFRVEVREWTGSGPGNLLGSQNLSAADSAVGVHGIALQNPVRVNATSFCVAVDANDAVAIRRDDSNPVPNRAFVKADECGIIDYVTLGSLDFPSNLCMSAKVVPVQ
jgi:hypothetical protein